MLANTANGKINICTIGRIVNAPIVQLYDANSCIYDLDLVRRRGFIYVMPVILSVYMMHYNIIYIVLIFITDIAYEVYILYWETIIQNGPEINISKNKLNVDVKLHKER